MASITLNGSTVTRNDANSIENNTLINVSLSSLLEFANFSIRVPASTTDYVVEFGGVGNVVFMQISSDQPISFKQNLSATSSPAGTFHVLTGSTGSYITDLSVSNDTASEAMVKFILGGS